MTFEVHPLAWVGLGALLLHAMVTTLVLVALWNLVGSYAVRGLGEAWRRELKRVMGLKK